MDELRSYVVRVYRQDDDGVAGVVESVESVDTGATKPFRTATELWATICFRPSTRPAPRTGGIG